MIEAGVALFFLYLGFVVIACIIRWIVAACSRPSGSGPRAGESDVRYLARLRAEIAKAKGIV